MSPFKNTFILECTVDVLETWHVNPAWLKRTRFVLLWDLVEIMLVYVSVQQRTLNKSRFTRYKKHTAIHYWSPCRLLIDLYENHVTSSGLIIGWGATPALKIMFKTLVHETLFYIILLITKMICVYGQPCFDRTQGTNTLGELMCPPHCFPIERVGRQDFPHVIAWP